MKGAYHADNGRGVAAVVGKPLVLRKARIELPIEARAFGQSAPMGFSRRIVARLLIAMHHANFFSDHRCEALFAINLEKMDGHQRCLTGFVLRCNLLTYRWERILEENRWA